MNFKEYCILNQKNFDHVKSIEKQVYPSRMHTYQDFDNIEDLLDYADCDGQIDCIVKQDWYAIFCNGSTEVEIIDLASRKPLGFPELIEIKNKLQSFGDKIITMNARESTSYRLIKLAAKRGMFEILSDEPNNQFGEPMHELILKIKPQNSFKEWYYYQEALDAETEKTVASFLSKKTPEEKQQAEEELEILRKQPNVIPKGQVLKTLQDKLGVVKKVKPKEEDAQRKHFATIPNTTEDELKTYDYYKSESPQALKEMMELLRKFIDKKRITLKFANNKPVIIRNTTEGKQKFDTPKFSNFIDALHQIQASLEQYKGKGNYFNPIEEELNHQNNLVAKGDNIWVFKGHAPDVCRIYGKGHPWCISSSTSATHWFSYRMEHHQTQYFVFDYNKDENDPARYVNPGVAPEGMYSEWVDAKNQHSKDPEDPKSHVGINGYRSINQYKKYLASKGIPESIWVTTAPEEWEERLKEYDDYKDFQGAKKDPDPRIFPMYLKIVSLMEDSDFDTLDVDQKKEFLLGKIYVTDKQLDYIFKNIKSEHYNSLNLGNKIRFAGRTNNQDLLLKLAENPNIDHDDVQYLLYNATDKDKIAEIIIEKKPELSENNVLYLLDYATDKDGIAELIIEKKPELSDDDVKHLLRYADDKDKIAERIIEKKPELSDDDIKHLLISTNDKAKDKIAELIIEKKPELSDDNISYLLAYANDKDQMAKIIIKYKPKLSNYNVKNLLAYANDKDKIAELIIEKKQKLLSDNNVEDLLFYAKDKDNIAALLQRETDNISKLSDNNVRDLLIFATNKTKMAQIINKYHTKKTPEIQKVIDTYL